MLTPPLAPPGRLPLDLPVRPLPVVSWLQAHLAYAPIKALLPLPILAAVAYPLWWFFRDTWRELDEDAARYRAELAARGEVDYRPAACFVIVAAVLTMQEYFGSRSFYDEVLRESLLRLAETHPKLRVQKYDELLGYAWWSCARFIGYVLIPLPLWKILFPRDRLLDMGLRLRGFFEHIWVYGLCLAIVLPLMLLVSTQPDFGSYYPFYKGASRSWVDFLSWEAMYWLQFFSLELFFRGWMVGALRRTLGSAAIFAMALPYCMIHYGKPYFEAHGAVVAGVVLGSLAMRTRSIYAGFLVHITVAVGMDTLSLYKRAALPVLFWAPG
ncbi:MAG TPA: CPBP family intramembrane glutamic endopeptidase [Polyangiaceae bacterium]|nr:CPBP family intramembrane glutamic endopeptidase [Polyangiaceae bacterium]